MNIPYQTLAIADDPTPWVITGPQEDGEWCVLWLQGWSSTIEAHFEGITRMATASNMPFAMLDYAGHGKHPVPLGETTRKQQFNEVLALFDLLRNTYSHVIVIGGSFGGYMSALLSGERSPEAIILRAPAIYDDAEFSTRQKDRADGTYQEFKKSVSATSDLIALHNLRQFNKSVYVLEHEIDSVIPKNIPKAYFEVAKYGNYLVIPSTDHSPKLMPAPAKHFTYIEAALQSLITLIQLEASLPKRRD